MKQITMNVPDIFMQEIEDFTSKGFAQEEVYAITVLGVMMASKDESLLKKYMKDPECKEIITKLILKGLES